MRITAYAYDAGIHCPECAAKRFGAAVATAVLEDREGNPVRAVFSTDETPEGGLYCGDCHAEIEPPPQRA